VDKIRRTLALLERQELSLNASRTTLVKARRQLWTDWHARAESDEIHDRASLQTLKCDLARYHERDRSLGDDVDAVDEQLSALRHERDDQSIKLRKALVNQEKLNSLLE
jgi:hypothetical protein